MNEPAWVVNASPLILLAKLERLDLLAALAPAVMVPQAVAEEIAAGAADGKLDSVLNWIGPPP